MIVGSSAIKRKPNKAKKEKTKVKLQDTLDNNIIKHKNPKGFDPTECIIIDKALTSKFDDCSPLDLM
jgi:hypothetical protein